MRRAEIREEFQQLLAEQNMEGIVRPDQMAKAGQVLGAAEAGYVVLDGPGEPVQARVTKTSRIEPTGAWRMARPRGGEVALI